MKRNKLNRIISIIMTTCFFITSMPMLSFAESYEIQSQQQGNITMLEDDKQVEVPVDRSIEEPEEEILYKGTVSQELQELIKLPAQAPPGATAPISASGEVSVMAASVDTTLAEEYNRYPVPPFDFSKVSAENISLNTGALYYQETDAVLPGKNGMDLVLGIRYDSGKAENVSIERLMSLSDGETVSPDKPFLGKNMLNRFAFGWSFGFPTMEKSKYSKNIYFTLADGRTYQYNTKNGYLVGQNLFDVQILESPNEFSWGGRVSQYTLEHSDGRREYYDKDGYLLGMQDRFQNTIGFT